MWTLAVVGMQGRTNFGGTLLKWALHRLEGNAAALRAGRRDRHRLGSRRDGAARRAKPTAAAHAILWPHDLVRWPKALDNVALGFHGARCRSRRAVGATSPRGFPGAAKRATIAGMSWHHVPKDDAWEHGPPRTKRAGQARQDAL